MSLDNYIKDAFERHAADTRPEPEAWHTIQKRVVRSHRRRSIGTALVTAFAVAAVAVVVPRLIREPRRNVESPQAGWTALRSDVGGYRLLYPPDWTAAEAAGAADLAPPGRPAGPDGKIWFSV